uniref:NADH dehydrogenase subunit 5 n=1 Tax=Glyphohesione klatti TaxID=3053539 RepID=UPI0030E0AEAD
MLITNFSRYTSLSLWVMFSIMLPTSLFLMFSTKTFLIEWTLFYISSIPITLPILLDPLGTLFSSAVLMIAANVIHFSTSYMQDDPFLPRFTKLVILFVLSMNFLIFIPHLICLLLGWDGLGITSFILIIYYQNPKSLAAGMFTALTNRIGDVMILLSIAWLLNQGHWTVFNIWASPFSWMICLSITIAAMTKSAQIPFSSWLPAAMAAPTPVSALVHSSTLVTAGVFLLIRFYPSLSNFKMFAPSLLICASLTMVMAGLSAMTECDFKKIIALSTLSQLGVMMASLGLGMPMLTFFHLITHAMFKSLLFLCAGSYIFMHHHSQDLRSMGNLFSQTPMSSSALMISNLALCGTPFMAGFYSKDLIIEMCLTSPTNMLIIAMFILGTMLTASYSMRMMVSILWGPSSSLPIQYINETNSNFTTPMFILSTGAISSGAVINWWIILPLIEPIISTPMKMTALLSVLTGALFAFMNTTKLSKAILIKAPTTHTSHALMWFITPLSTQPMIKPPLLLSHKLLKSIDQGWLEFLGPQGLMLSFKSMNKHLQYIQSNLITTQLSMIFLLIMLLLLHIL